MSTWKQLLLPFFVWWRDRRVSKLCKTGEYKWPLCPIYAARQRWVDWATTTRRCGGRLEGLGFSRDGNPFGTIVVLQCEKCGEQQRVMRDDFMVGKYDTVTCDEQVINKN